ncbi:MAG: hypothetical protein JWN46_2374 [Acidimicrobiales bacterium]|nr:hypothetical protein [Acidimicrobiales bacterium]
MTSATPMATHVTDNYANAKAFNGHKVRVYSWYLDNTTHLATAVNNYVYLTVSC